MDPTRSSRLAGAGGMGEVYKGRDTRLERTVAIKVLPPHASASTDLKQRFEREAQTIASLKHPHICVLHDIGSDGSTDFIVMEYLQGQTLAERLARGKGRGSGATAAGTSKPASGSIGARDASQAETSKSEGPAVGRALKLDEALAIAIQIAGAMTLIAAALGADQPARLLIAADSSATPAPRDRSSDRDFLRKISRG